MFRQHSQEQVTTEGLANDECLANDGPISPKVKVNVNSPHSEVISCMIGTSLSSLTCKSIK